MIFIFFALTQSFWQQHNIDRFKNVDPYQILGLGKDFTKKQLDSIYSRYVDQRLNVKPGTAISRQMQQQWDEFEYSYNILSNPASKEIFDNHGIEYFNITDSSILGFKGDEELMMMKNMGMQVPELYDTYGGALTFPVQFSMLEFFKGATRLISINNVDKCICPKEEDLVCPECEGVDDNLIANELTLTLPPGAPYFYRFFAKDAFDTELNRAPHDILFIAVQSETSIKDKNLPAHKFVRIGNDIVTNFTLPLAKKIRGGSFQITNIDGEVVEASIETQGGVAISRGKGFPFVGEPQRRGNLIVNVNIVYPTKPLTKKQREIVNSILPDDISEYE